MITLANGTQAIAKGISSINPLPSLPLTSVLYVPETSFNLISISKLTRDLNYLITFSKSSVTLQDQSTKKTIGIRESQGLFHLNSAPSSTVCILTHDRFGDLSIFKFRKMVPRFSNSSSIEC